MARRYGHEIRDGVAHLERQREHLLTNRTAAEERIKRATTEITQNRTLETERRRVLAGVDSRFSQIQTRLDEIERQRVELINQLMETRDEREKADNQLKVAHQGTARAQELLRDADAEREEAGRQLKDIESERTRQHDRLRDAYVQALEAYLAEVAKRLEQAFASEEERQRRRALARAFKDARHQDRRIGDLCDQRDQYQQLLPLATVPGVRASIEAELRRVEEHLERLFPGALSASPEQPLPATVEDLHYFIDRQGKCGILLPVSASVWQHIAEGDAGLASKVAMRLFWALISGAGLKAGDGEFETQGSHCVFRAQFSADIIGALPSFRMAIEGGALIEFRVCPLPSEMQEVFADEPIFA
jgi:hypothetical protein